MNPYILHIEDSDVDHELFIRVVHGIDVKWFMTTFEGYAFLQTLSEEEHPALIVIDLNLPAENGIKLIQRIKQNEKFKKIPVVVLSSITDEKEINDCYLMGASGFLKKSLRPQEVTEKVDALLKFFFEACTLPNKVGSR